MFTIKYRRFNPAGQAPDGRSNFLPVESIDGPFTHVSQEWQDGYAVVYAHRGDALGMTYGPHGYGEDYEPRPTLWVMNEQGATIAKYGL